MAGVDVHDHVWEVKSLECVRYPWAVVACCETLTCWEGIVQDNCWEGVWLDDECEGGVWVGF